MKTPTKPQNLLALTLCSVAFLVLQACSKQESQEEKPVTKLVTAENKDSLSQEQKLAYSIGFAIGKQAGEQFTDINVDYAKSGLEDALKGEETFTDEELRLFFQDYQRQQLEQQQLAQASSNQEYLDTFKQQEGVQELGDGIFYKVLQPSESATKATDQDTVKVHYKGSLTDGTVFDTSEGREPVEFSLGQIIAGWQKALKAMPVGSKWQVYIPPEQGYGEVGAGGVIPPNAALVFEIELLDVQQPATSEPEAPANPQ